MPELPEVEIMTRNLRRWAGGATLRSVTLTDPALLVESSRAAFSAAAHEGASVQRIWRRAKYLCMQTSVGAWIFHFRMTGKLVPSHLSSRERVRIEFDNGSSVSFSDRRRLGHVAFVEDAAAFFETLALGPEPYPEGRDGAWWAARFEGLRQAIKPALLRQERVAGVGNILASELCFRARIDPRRAAREVVAASWERLSGEVVPLIDAVVAHEQGDEIAYLGDGGDVEDTVFDVYAREGRPCRVCGHAIERFVQAGRATFWCPRCQTGD